MENKLKELIGKSNIWLLIASSHSWVKNAEIFDVDSETVSFRYQAESPTETKIWEKTTKLENIVEVDLRVATIPKSEAKLQEIKDKLTRQWEE